MPLKAWTAARVAADTRPARSTRRPNASSMASLHCLSRRPEDGRKEIAAIVGMYPRYSDPIGENTRLVREIAGGVPPRAGA